MIIPAELFNGIAIPTSGSTVVYLKDYVKTIAYKLPQCSNVMIEKELWNTICDFAERTGALRERSNVKALSANDHAIDIGSNGYVPTYGDFLRVIGAEIGDGKVSIKNVSVSDSSNGAKVTFTATSGNAKVLYSVIPDINAAHDTSSGGTDNWKAPKWFLREYERLLIMGTAYRLYGMSGKAWTDFNQAKAFALAYNREINRVSHGLITAGMRKHALAGHETAFMGVAQQPQQAQQQG